MTMASLERSDAAWAEMAAPPGEFVPEAVARQPRARERLDIRRQLELDRELIFAHIFVSLDGGPVRTIINGLHNKPTGREYMIKSAFRAAPWESMRGERSFMRLCEVASPVRSYLAQPHRLEMQIIGDIDRWVYFPDARIEVDEGFADMLKRGVPFAEAVADWHPDMTLGRDAVLLVEIKTDKDRRAQDDLYRAKLGLAREVYERLGWQFAEVLTSRDLAVPKIERAVHEMCLDHDTSITAEDVRVARECTGSGVDLGQLITELGGRPLGMAKAAALHVRRVISLGLEEGLAEHTAVHLVPAGQDLFGVMRK